MASIGSEPARDLSGPSAASTLKQLTGTAKTRGSRSGSRPRLAPKRLEHPPERRVTLETDQFDRDLWPVSSVPVGSSSPARERSAFTRVDIHEHLDDDHDTPPDPGLVGEKRPAARRDPRGSGSSACREACRCRGPRENGSRLGRRAGRAGAARSVADSLRATRLPPPRSEPSSARSARVRPARRPPRAPVESPRPSDQLARASVSRIG